MSDYNFLMEIRLSPDQLRTLNFLSRIAASQGLNLYLVGGAVRDLTYGMTNVRDLDFAVVGSARKFLRAISSPPSPKPKARSIPGAKDEYPSLEILDQRVDAKRQVAEVLFAPGVRAEIGSTRTETYPKPGSAPVIAPAGIFEDLKRRDFSINAMAVSLHPNSRGLLLDPTNGAADIERHELRALHSRSFLEDPSRIYRLIRLSMRLNFKPEAKTQIWLDQAMEQKAWAWVHPDQQGREIQEILREDDPGRLLKLLGERGLLAGLDDHLSLKKIPFAQFEKIRAAGRNLPNADLFLLYFSALAEKLPSPYRTKFAKKVLGEGKLAEAAARLDAEARKAAQELKSRKGSVPSQVYRLLSSLPSYGVLYMLVNLQQPAIQSAVKNFLIKFPQVRAKLPREELLSMGLEPGPKFDEVLESVFLAQIDGKIRTPTQLTKALRTLSGIAEPPAHAEPEKPAPTKNAKGSVAFKGKEKVKEKVQAKKR
jgi:tRNA nucleotidyltransferase (CCA-adding enzyme)